jgi:hypothetical protein
MANLVTTISESVSLNGALRGSTNSVTTTDIVDVFERIVRGSADVQVEMFVGLV